MRVVIVESPAKAKTINKYLGSNYKVFASFGHVRDLPAKDGSVLPNEDFAMKWDIDKESSKRLSDIAKAVKESDGIILATDPDREGEAISWHVYEVLHHKKVLQGKPVERVVFNAITRKAILDAMEHPRAIDAHLVDAYLARRALDYLFGFNLSPVLWRKLPGARSAGRVQSVALRLVCNREAEIERFIREEYWTLAIDLITPRQDVFSARLVHFSGNKLGKLDIKTAAEAETIRLMLSSARFQVQTIESKPVKRNPGPPFTTSSLQQAASSRLGFSPSRTMQVAQRLYEGINLGHETTGLITYMRTDGVQIVPEAIDAARKTIESRFGSPYIPEKPRFYATKAKNAQEAHEAIRPTDFNRSPEDVRAYLDQDQFRLYELIWKRSVASQMCSAEIERTTVEIEARTTDTMAGLRATGSVIRFDGFLAAYADSREDENKDQSGEQDDASYLPPINVNEFLDCDKVSANQHMTEPPPRYSEASLIKKMEELGIGRPSTYASILTTLHDRDYVTSDKRKLIPGSRGRIVTAFLENFFHHYVEYDFTAELEEKLDLISDDKLQWQAVLHDFWQNFSASIDNIKELRVSEVLDVLNDVLAFLLFPQKEEDKEPRLCPQCENGQLSLKLGRYGAFIGCSCYPDCNYTRQLGNDTGEQTEHNELSSPMILGQNNENGENISLRSGRFGPYVQQGEGTGAKRASLPKGWEIATIDLEKALALLALPREIGIHPEYEQPVMAHIGRYGPYLSCNGHYAHLETVEDVFTVGLNRAVTIIAEKPQKNNRKTATQAKALATLGEHPDGGVILVQDGRYGPYLKWNSMNVTLPKDREPNSVTLEEALQLIAEKSTKTKKRPIKKAATISKKSAASRKPKTPSKTT